MEEIKRGLGDVSKADLEATIKRLKSRSYIIVHLDFNLFLLIL